MHLRTTKEAHRVARRRIHRGIPDLSAAPAVQLLGHARDDAVQRGAHQIRLEFDRSEVGRRRRQQHVCARPTYRVGERHQTPRVTVSVWRQVPLAQLQLAFDPALAHVERGDSRAEGFRQPHRPHSLVQLVDAASRRHRTQPPHAATRPLQISHFGRRHTGTEKATAARRSFARLEITSESAQLRTKMIPLFIDYSSPAYLNSRFLFRP